MSEQKLRKPVRLGINPLDLPGLPESVWLPVLKGRIAFDKHLLERVDLNRPDELVAVFTREVLESALCLDKLLSDVRALSEGTNKIVFRCYIHRGLSWVKLRGDVVCTLWDETTDSYVLNPDVFPLAEAPVVPSDIKAPVQDFSLFKRRT
jgi:hypothetical protein